MTSENPEKNKKNSNASFRLPVYLFTCFRSFLFTCLRSRLFLWLPTLLFLLYFFFFPLTRILNLTFSLSTLTNPNNLLITFNSLLFTFYQATLSTLLTFLLGIPSAILFSRFDFRGKSLLRALTAVPFMLPTVVVAAAFNSIFGERGLFLVLSSSITNYQLPFILHPSPFILILTAHVFYNTTIVIRIVGNALSRLDPKLEQAARSLGAGTFRVWKNITIPLLRPSLLAAALLVFMFDFTSFGVILLLGGSTSPPLKWKFTSAPSNFPTCRLPPCSR